MQTRGEDSQGDRGDGGWGMDARSTWGWLCQLRRGMRESEGYKAGEDFWWREEERLDKLEALVGAVANYADDGEEVEGALDWWEDEFEEDLGEFLFAYAEFLQKSGELLGMSSGVVEQLCRLVQGLVEVVSGDDGRDADERGPTATVKRIGSGTPRRTSVALRRTSGSSR